MRNAPICCFLSFCLYTLISGAPLRAQDSNLLADATALAKTSRTARRTWIEVALDTAKVPYERADYLSRGKPGVNLELRFGPKQGEVLILSAHHDVRDRSEGANDDASGCAVLLELARRLHGKPPEQPVMILFFDASEKGLKGSQGWIDGNPGLPVRAVVNLENCGRGDRIVIGPTRAKAGNLIAEDCQRLGAAALTRFPAADHKSFLAAGVDAVTLSVVSSTDLERIQAAFASPPRPPLPDPWGAAHAGRDGVDVLEAKALDATLEFLHKLVGDAAVSASGLPLNPGFSKLRREFLKSLGVAELPELKKSAEALGAHGVVLAMARGLRDEALADRIRELVPRLFAGAELQKALEEAADEKAMLAAWARLRRGVRWDRRVTAFKR